MKNFLKIAGIGVILAVTPLLQAGRLRNMELVLGRFGLDATTTFSLSQIEGLVDRVCGDGQGMVLTGTQINTVEKIRDLDVCMLTLLKTILAVQLDLVTIGGSV